MEFFKPEDFSDTMPIEIWKNDLITLANKANRLLGERGTVAYGRKFTDSSNWEFHDFQNHCKDQLDTHTGLIIGIESIRPPDTLEIISRDILNSYEKYEGMVLINQFVKRIKSVLEAK